MRDFFAATYVVYDGKVLLVRDQKEGGWVPPGRHLAEDELPEEAAVRAVAEECGLAVELLGKEQIVGKAVILREPAALVLEKPHKEIQHITFIYFALPKARLDSLGVEEQAWFAPEDLDQRDIPLHVAKHSRMAIQEMAKGDMDTEV